jgi:SAM-dependent methyltransferase
MDLTEVPAGPFRRHPWEVARARFFGRVFREMGLPATPRAVLDVGAGDGYSAGALLPELPAGSSVVCLDTNYSAGDLRRYMEAAPAGLSFVKERPTTRFDLLLLLDVLEHVEDDHGFLVDLVRQNLAPGGSVLVSVPAWQPLFGRHDVGLLHHRRYSPAACRALLTAGGLDILRSGGLFHSLLLARLAAVIGERASRRLGRQPRARAHLGEWRGGVALSSVLERVLTLDNAVTHALARRDWALPGLSFWAVCERSDGQPVGSRA